LVLGFDAVQSCRIGGCLGELDGIGSDGVEPLTEPPGPRVLSSAGDFWGVLRTCLDVTAQS